MKSKANISEERAMNGFRKFGAVILGLGMLGFILLSHVPETGAEIEQEQECHAQMRKFCEGNLEQNVGEFHRCLESHLADLPQSCQWEWKQLVEMHKREMAACGDDYRKLCGIDKDKLKAADYEQAAEKITACVGENLGLLSDGCWEFVKETSGPLLEGMDREKLRREALQKTQRRKKVKVKGKGWVTAEAQEGDVIWYKAKERQRKIVDRYPFCPEVKDKGLELVDAVNMGTCFYDVTSSWEQELLEKLEKAQILKDLPAWSGGMRNYFNQLSQSERTALNGNREIRAVSFLVKILDQYNGYCPEGFKTEVYTSTQLIDKIQKRTGYAGITCEKVRMDGERFSCQEGYQKSFYDKFSRNRGYFGCIKYASCEETNPKYAVAGGGCVECNAGGCVDYEMSEELKGWAVCQVNYKDPGKTPPCPEYYIKKWYNPDGSLQSEEYKQLNRTIKTKVYDQDGQLLFYADYKDGKPLKEYFADGTLHREWIRKDGQTVIIEYDRRGKVISEY